MAPIVKEAENLTATSTPAALPNAVVKNPQDPATRSQPVPLEVPVSVNGARTIEGTDKREPFSESTKTVLVFANGAVIRLASSVTPGQLLFVTNEKSKKEVVCQVVKSKNYRTVTGYVELEFTEPAAGFWGIRIPTDQAVAPSVAPKAPVAPRPVAPPAAPVAAVPVVAAPRIPVAALVPPVAPIAAKTNIPVAAPPAKASVVAPPVALVTAAKLEAKPPVVAEVPARPVAPPQTVAAKQESLPAQLADQLSALLGSVSAPSVLPKPPNALPTAVSVEPTQKSNDATSEELRQQAARLQEQLSSLLFRQEAAEKKNTPAATPTFVEPVREQKPAAEVTVRVAPINPPAATPPAPVFDAKPASVLAGPAETKPIPAALKPAAISLKVEEVKIPSWLAPLARESEAATEPAAGSEMSSSAQSESASSTAANKYSDSASEEGSSRSQSVVFGGQLLGGASESEQKASRSGSKTGLFLGLAAAAALLIGGGVWYSRQPGNLLTSKPAASESINSNSSPANVPAPAAAATIPASALNSSSASSVLAPTSNKLSAVQPASVPPVDATRANNAPAASAAKSVNSTPRVEPLVEQPKKPALGDVRLATPNVNRSGGSVSSESAPTIDSPGAANTGEPFDALASNHGKQPAAPLPIGGDVKPARLLKPTPPVYPTAARTQRVSGDVQVDALIDAEGNVTSTKVISGPVQLHQSAANAVKQWKYAPALLDGKPTAMHLTVTVQFRLQ
ncbi:MAG TPA: TonB family protein [Candidatus Acidoferrum sp.]